MSAIITDTSYPLKDIADPGVNDVMCGRGGGTNNHIGNRRFRMLVNEHKLRYIAATKLDKPKVAREVMIMWRKQDPPGRFLSKDANTKLWNDVGDQKAREKASQCLRERRTPSDVLPFLMPGKKKKLQQVESQAGHANEDDGADSECEEGESSEGECSTEPEKPARRKTLPRLEQIEKIQQLQQMQQLQQQEMKLQEMRLLLAQQQQQQHLLAVQQQQQQQQQPRMFPRQLARAQTLPAQVDGSAPHQFSASNQQSIQGQMQSASMPPPAAPQTATAGINNMTQLQAVQAAAGVPVVDLNNQLQKSGLYRTSTDPATTGFENGEGFNANVNNFSAGGNNLSLNAAAAAAAAKDQSFQLQQATTAAANAFRMDLNQKYGFTAPSEGQQQTHHAQEDSVPSTGPAIEGSSATGASSLFGSMRSLEFEDLQEWADISSRSIGVSSKSLGVSSRSLTVDKRSGTSAASDDIEDDNMDWMKSFKSINNSNKDLPLNKLPGVASPGNSLRNIMNAVDENNAQGFIQPLGFNLDEQSTHSWSKNSLARKNSQRRLKLGSAKAPSTTSMMSELTDLSADLVALDLASMES